MKIPIAIYMLALIPLFPVLVFLAVQGFVGKAFKTDRFGPLTRERRRNSGLRTFQESYGYVGTCERYIESRWTCYKLFGIPIGCSWSQRNVEISMHLIIAHTFLHESICGAAVDAAFPAELRTGWRWLGNSAAIRDEIPTGFKV